MGSTDFYVDYEAEVPSFPDELKAEIEKRLLDLASYHTDMVGAAVSVRTPGKGEMPFLFQARIVVYTRPEDVVAVKKSDTLQGALKGALSAIERQVREKRNKLGEPWKREDIRQDQEQRLDDALAEDLQEDIREDLNDSTV